ncbi:hypothetical protein [Polaromonas hydrogenivorans]|uniref:Uncharacterized protein n=1 Tax=Polaromonas hydrogenivorans TaxID=335476 RepID=A0AAU7M2D0_9BURK
MPKCQLFECPKMLSIYQRPPAINFNAPSWTIHAVSPTDAPRSPKPHADHQLQLVVVHFPEVPPYRREVLRGRFVSVFLWITFRRVRVVDRNDAITVAPGTVVKDHSALAKARVALGERVVFVGVVARAATIATGDFNI